MDKAGRGGKQTYLVDVFPREALAETLAQDVLC